MQDMQYWICINTVDPRMWLIGEKKSWTRHFGYRKEKL